MTTQKCIECKTDKTLDNFHKRNDSGKYRNMCTLCHNNKNKLKRNYTMLLNIKYKHCTSCYRIPSLINYYQLVDDAEAFNVLERREILENSSERYKILNGVFYNKCISCCTNESYCTCCKTVKPLNNFQFIQTTNKPCSQCKECIAAKKKKDKQDNPEKYREAKRKYRSNPEVKAKEAKIARDRRKCSEVKEKEKEYRERPEVKERMKEYRKQPKVKEQMKEYRERPEIKEKIQERMKEYRALPEVKKRHAENQKCPKVKEQMKEYRRRPEVKEHRKKYNKQHKSNPEVKERINERARERYATDINYKMTSVMRSRFRQVVLNEFKGDSVLVMVGCSDDHLIKWLEFQFDENMDWDNHGSYWHVDHIKPCASFDFTNVDDQKECFHWTNLQPLFKTDNLIKSNTYNDEIKNKAQETLQDFIDIYSDFIEESASDE